MTADTDFGGIDCASFVPDFVSHKLRVISFETSFEFLSKRYFEESVIKPYQQEAKNALATVEAQTSQILKSGAFAALKV